MTTIICGTNRAGNKTSIFAQYLYEHLRDNLQQEVQYLSLEDVPTTVLHLDTYEASSQHPTLKQLQDKYVLNSDKFIFVFPEYNGSYPGILKLFIDVCSIRSYKANFSGKKAALIGTATGRAGNLRGIDHFRGVLSHLGMHVLPSILPISQINKLISEEDVLVDSSTQEMIDIFAKQVVAY